MKSRWWVEWSGWPARGYHATYDLGLRRRKTASVPVISVGALSMGGAGKTPFVELIMARLACRGLRAAAISRGYGRVGRIPLVVSHGRGPVVGVRRSGDEPHMLARRTGGIVVVGQDRHAAVELAAQVGAEVAVLDDGFQHRRLRRDLDVVLVDEATAPAGLVLPFGAAREPPSALRRADLVVAVSAGQGPNNAARRPSWVDRDAIRVGVETEPWRVTHGALRAPPRRAVLVSAIARPDRFRRTVESLGVEVVSHVRYRDHRWLSDRDVAAAERRVCACGADGLITTEKDAVRWPRGASAAWVLPIHLVPLAGEGQLEAALAAVAGMADRRRRHRRVER